MNQIPAFHHHIRKNNEFCSETGSWKPHKAGVRELMYGTYGSLPHRIPLFFLKSTLLFLFQSLSTVIDPHLFLSMSCFTYNYYFRLQLHNILSLRSIYNTFSHSYHWILRVSFNLNRNVITEFCYKHILKNLCLRAHKKNLSQNLNLSNPLFP